jgi:hypothetical protein
MLILALTGPAFGEDPKILEYEDPAGVYTFNFPDYYNINHEFADGTGDAVGIRAEIKSKDGTSTEESTIAVYQIEPRAVTTLNNENFEAYVEQYKKDFEPNPKIKFVSAKKIEILSQLGAEILFDQKTYGGKIYSLHLFATVIDAKDTSVNCVYSPGYHDEFAYHCKFAAQSLKFATAQ